MHRVLPVALLAAALLGVAAGCGGSGDSAPVATTEVTMAKSYRFDPQKIEVAAGSSVTWTNEDNFTHTVQVDGQDDHKVARWTAARASRSRSTSRAPTTTSARCTAATWTAR